jgi:Tfp pilus assembly protein PilV
MRRRRAANRGSTLIEVMISMGIVLVGMLALFSVLGTSINGSSSASRITQAETRAITILESIRHSPPLALACLVNNGGPANWSACEQLCLTALPNQNYDGCIYTLGRFTVVNAPTDMGQTVDRSLQTYLLDPRSRVTLAGTNNNVFDIDVFVSWNDDNSSDTSNPNKPGYHAVHLRTGVFPNQ